MDVVDDVLRCITSYVTFDREHMRSNIFKIKKN